MAAVGKDGVYWWRELRLEIRDGRWRCYSRGSKGKWEELDKTWAEKRGAKRSGLQTAGE